MNAPATIETARVMTPWEARFRAALGGPNEAWQLVKLYQEMDAEGHDIAASFYDLAETTDAEYRAELICEIEGQFATWAAEEAYDSAAYRYECATGRLADDATSPYFDRVAWIKDRARQAEVA